MRLMFLRIASDPIRKPRNSFIVVLYMTIEAQRLGPLRRGGSDRGALPGCLLRVDGLGRDEIEPSRCPRALRHQMRVRHIPAQSQFDA